MPLRCYQCSVWPFFHLPSQGGNGSFANFVERLSAAAIFLVDVPKFGPAAAAPAPTALLCSYYTLFSIV